MPFQGRQCKEIQDSLRRSEDEAKKQATRAFDAQMSAMSYAGCCCLMLGVTPGSCVCGLALGLILPVLTVLCAVMGGSLVLLTSLRFSLQPAFQMQPGHFGDTGDILVEKMPPVLAEIVCAVLPECRGFRFQTAAGDGADHHG